MMQYLMFEKSWIETVKPETKVLINEYWESDIMAFLNKN